MTDFELAIVHLVADGITNKEVAERLCIFPHTATRPNPDPKTKPQGTARSCHVRTGLTGDAALTRKMVW